MEPNFAQIIINALPQVWDVCVSFWLQLLSNAAVFWPIVGVIALGMVSRPVGGSRPRRRRRRA